MSYWVMIWVIIIVLLLALLVLPGWWVRRTLSKYSEPADRYRDRGTGAELARHLLDQMGLKEVAVEETDRGDHYDPDAKAVRLSADYFKGSSLTAITVAAHEVGHAIQDDRGEVLFKSRQRLVRAALKGERLGSILLIAAPLMLVLAKIPQASLLLVVMAIASMGLGALVHLVTLPVELDASFGKALPMLEKGGYLQAGDEDHAKKILKAAALTYVAGSLASLLNLGRWLAVLRR